MYESDDCCDKKRHLSQEMDGFIESWTSGRRQVCGWISGIRKVARRDQRNLDIVPRDGQ